MHFIVANLRSPFCRLLAGGAATLAIASAALTASPYPSAQQEYWTQLEHRDWSAAVTAAEKLVNAARDTAASDPQVLADALTLLGNAQLASRNLPAAEAAFTEALQLIEPRVGATSEKLLEPMRGLGHTLATGGKHAQAIPYLQKALVIARRNSGLFDVNQQGLLRQLANSLTAVDQVQEAETHILYMLRIGERTYGNRDLRMVPLLCIVGDWYSQVGALMPARQSYRVALDIAEDKAGKNSLAVIEPLRSLAASYRRELYLTGAGLMQQREDDQGSMDFGARDNRPISAQLLSSEGERSLLRAVKILDNVAPAAGTNASAPDRNTQLKIDTVVDVGDWYQIRSQPQKALPYYKEAATLVAAAGASMAAADPLSFPVQVYMPTPLLATRHRYLDDAAVDERFVRVEFTVTSDGAVKDEHVVDQDGTARQVTETLAAIHAARYRPKFVGGEPVDTLAVSYRQVFRQRKDKDTAPEEDKENP